MNKIKKLSDEVINLISAGEVIERPASVVKELVENSIDAEAKKITIWLEQGGKNLIAVVDTGYGISKEDLLIAADQYTTSKLRKGNLIEIHTLGFRGEALASMAQISRMKIISKYRIASEAYELSIIKGNKGSIEPSKLDEGTKVEVRDLFFSTPARLKFLRNDKLEELACLDIIKKISIIYPEIEFSCFSDEKLIFSYENNKSLKDRLEHILGKQFIENSIPIKLESDLLKVNGFISLPTFHKAKKNHQFFFINNRYVNNDILSIAVKTAYKDYIINGRYPIVVILIECDKYFIDINVHPTKSEIRFRDNTLVYKVVFKAISEAIRKSQYIVADNSDKLIDLFTHKSMKDVTEVTEKNNWTNNLIPILNNEREIRQNHINQVHKEACPLGYAINQLFFKYILSKTNESIIIVDQHAAHERIVYEKLKNELDTKNNIIEQKLLIPVTVELFDEKRQVLMNQYKDDLLKFGIRFDYLSFKSILVTSIPFFLTDINIISMIQDIAENLTDVEIDTSITDISKKIIGIIACHNSIRAGKKLSIDEMNELLRQIETTPYSAQCKHGRPTYVELKIKDLDKLFGR